MSSQDALHSLQNLTTLSLAQAALSTAHTIMLPILSDQLWIITDRAFCKPGIGATLTSPLMTRLTQLSDAPQSKMFSVAMNISTLPGWPHSQNAQFTMHTWASTTGNASFVKAQQHEDIKRYLNVTTIAQDSLLFVKHNKRLAPTHECIVISWQVLEGLLTV